MATEDHLDHNREITIVEQVLADTQSKEVSAEWLLGTFCWVFFCLSGSFSPPISVVVFFLACLRLFTLSRESCGCKSTQDDKLTTNSHLGLGSWYSFLGIAGMDQQGRSSCCSDGGFLAQSEGLGYE